MKTYLNQTYRPSFLFKFAHINTIYSSVSRKVETPQPQQERIFTPDDDFLDMDWYKQNSDTLVIITHGLEGNSWRLYIKGMVNAVLRAGWDALAWNFRSCSGEMNKQPYLYHSGFTIDLHTVVQHVVQTQRYKKIALVGSSLGGNLILKYLGEETYKPLPAELRAAVTYSVPTDLTTSSIKIASWQNTIYNVRFLKSLKKKIELKSRLYPERISIENFHQVKNFKDFDDRYTAPLNGYKDAKDYWEKCSSKPFIPHITIPTLIFNAMDDPFLTPECHPIEEAQQNTNVTFELTRYGGHVGFVQAGDEYWSETRSIDFLKQVL